MSTALESAGDGVLRWSPGGIVLELGTAPDRPVLLRSLRPAGSDPVPGARPVPLVEVDVIGPGRDGDTASAQHRPSLTAAALRHLDSEVTADGALVVRQAGGALRVTTRLQSWPGVPVLRATTEVENVGADPLVLVYVSSLALGAFGAGLGPAVRLHEARNGWLTELRWQELTPEQAGIVAVPHPPEPWGSTRGRHAVTASGTWSSADFVPMGAVEDRARGVSWTWQVEHQGAWHWEATEVFGDLAVLVSGPTGDEHHWEQPLAPGDTVTSVPVAVAVTRGSLHDGIRALTSYRRRLRRPSDDTATLPVVFNDFMNTLMGDADAGRLTPLIAAAAEVGAEYFVIDAGWYAEGGDWWDTVGEWQPSTTRFPAGLAATLREIVDAGMRPGLWLEPEVVGVRSPLADRLPADAFFSRGGRRLTETGRHHLDYRCPAVREHMDAVVDRLVGGMGVRYLKLDFNISMAPGTDARDASPGVGLLGHQRAYLAWLDAVLDRHPGLLLENCASGGMRTDYAMLSRLSLHSTSDQRDLHAYAPIAAAAPSAVTPEQGASWAYPQPEHTAEEASFTLVNALLGRVCLSGHLDRMSPEQRARVRAAVEAHKAVRGRIPLGAPVWPLGLPGWYDDALALGLAGDGELLLSVWLRGGRSQVDLPLPGAGGWQVDVVFPADLPTDWSWTGDTLALRVPSGPAARTLRLRPALSADRAPRPPSR